MFESFVEKEFFCPGIEFMGKYDLIVSEKKKVYLFHYKPKIRKEWMVLVFDNKYLLQIMKPESILLTAYFSNPYCGTTFGEYDRSFFCFCIDIRMIIDNDCQILNF